MGDQQGDAMFKAKHAKKQIDRQTAVIYPSPMATTKATTPAAPTQSALEALLLKIKPVLDKARAVCDQVDAAILKLDGTLVGKIVSHFPEVGSAVGIVVDAAGVLAELVDAIDGVVDANTAPALTAATTPLLQASIAGTTEAVK
jgi:hypothetical protein